MNERTDYCTAIAALIAEAHKIPSNKAILANLHRQQRANLHRQQRELQEQAAKEFAVLNGWRYSERRFSIKPRNAGRRSLGSRAASQERSANLGHPD
jgi:hypothetical protein